VNERLVRGLDYYNLTVFEWVTNSLGAQGTVCAGGRYDGLVEQLGGQPTPAVGFAMGMERLVLMLETLELNGDIRPAVMSIWRWWARGPSRLASSWPSVCVMRCRTCAS